MVARIGIEGSHSSVAQNRPNSPRAAAHRHHT